MGVSKVDACKSRLESAEFRLKAAKANMATAKACLEHILLSVKEAEVGKIYTGRVTRVEKYGVFVELWPGTEGLCHISKLALERVEKAEDVVSLNDEIIVNKESFNCFDGLCRLYVCTTYDCVCR